MALAVIVVFLLMSMGHVLTEKPAVGTYKNCSIVTHGQAVNAVKYSTYEGCCIKKADEITGTEFRYESKQQCCIPPEKKCSEESGRTTCCNQLRCYKKKGSAFASCEQSVKYDIMDIREDSKNCLDKRKPVHVVLDFTLRRKKNDPDLVIKDISYCCNATFRGKSSLIPMEHHCCGTGYAICDFPIKSRKVRLDCCGSVVKKRKSNCGPFGDPLSANLVDVEVNQNRMFLAKKSGKTIDQIGNVPNPLDHGYGMCAHYSSGRFDLTKDLYKSPGSDIVAQCDANKRRKGIEQKVHCPSSKKVMYQFQEDTNICCTKGGWMFENDEEAIHKDCCVNNYDYNGVEGEKQIPYSKHGTSFCEVLTSLKCCETEKPCEGRKKLKDNGNEYALGGNNDQGRCPVHDNKTLVYCAEDYLFDGSDARFEKDMRIGR